MESSNLQVVVLDFSPCYLVKDGIPSLLSHALQPYNLNTFTSKLSIGLSLLFMNDVTFLFCFLFDTSEWEHLSLCFLKTIGFLQGAAASSHVVPRLPRLPKPLVLSRPAVPVRWRLLSSGLFQLVLPEYLIHFFFCVMFLCAAEWLTLFLNLPLLAYHVWRWVTEQPAGHRNRNPLLCLWWADLLVFFIHIFDVPQVYEQTRDELSRTLWPDYHHECRHPGLLSKRRLVQTGFLPPLILLLSLWVHGFFYYLSHFENRAVPWQHSHLLKLLPFCHNKLLCISFESSVIKSVGFTHLDMEGSAHSSFKLRRIGCAASVNVLSFASFNTRLCSHNWLWITLAEKEPVNVFICF